MRLRSWASRPRLDARRASARGALAKSARGARRIAAVDAIDAGLELGFDDGSIRERELFAECVVSTESKALRHLFFAEREASDAELFLAS